MARMVGTFTVTCGALTSGVEAFTLGVETFTEAFTPGVETFTLGVETFTLGVGTFTLGAETFTWGVDTWMLVTRGVESLTALLEMLARAVSATVAGARGTLLPTCLKPEETFEVLVPSDTLG